jgi:hypothetical protein
MFALNQLGNLRTPTQQIPPQAQTRQMRVQARQMRAQARQMRALPQAPKVEPLDTPAPTKTITVIGGYKCATTTLKDTFNALKTHHLYNKRKMHDDVTTIMFPFRNNASVFPSAFFQDITNPRKEYCPFKGLNGDMKKTALETPAEVLFTFFKNNIHLFEKSLNLNNITRINLFNKTYGCAIDYLNPDIQTFNIVVNGIPRKLIAFDQNVLFSKFEELKMAVYSTPRPDIKLVDRNVGVAKWYGPKYVEFMKIFNERMIPKSRADQIKDGTTYN